MENKDENKSKKYIPDLSGKLLFLRHGQTWFNKQRGDDSRRYNPEFCDAHLTDTGIEQIVSRQNSINSLNLEKVYVSPYYRALQTVTLALQNHPNLNEIKVIVHPKISEMVLNIQDFFLDIKETKKDFNMNSKVKIDWSYFDAYAKKSKYEENFLYFENLNLLDENEKNFEYLKLKEIYEKGEKKELKKEIGNFLKIKCETFSQFESFKHAYQRFEEFKLFLKNELKDTLNDNNKKILCISHGSFINNATSRVPFLNDKINEKPDNLYQIKNGEIISLLF